MGFRHINVIKDYFDVKVDFPDLENCKSGSVLPLKVLILHFSPQLSTNC